jgi:hypothetical protein
MLRNTEGGCLLDIEVVPNSDAFGVEGIDPWTSRLKIRVTESPIKGKANKELVKRLEDALGTAPEIVAGIKTSKKTLFIRLATGEVKERLGI